MGSNFIPPPINGWNTFDPIAGLDPLSADTVGSYAAVLDNLMPDAGQMRVRPGFRAWASGLPGPVGGLLAYKSGVQSRLFATSGPGIYEVTAPGTVGAAVVSGLSNPRWDGLMVAASGGQFLLAFNGSDAAWQFDGTSWALWTGTGVPMPVGWANVFKRQPYVGRRDRLSFWYGVPGAIGGAFVEFPLQGVASLGGGIAGMATWTIDGGQGIDDYAVFYTTEGELIVYKGVNPDDSTTWSLVGTFRMPRPIGNRFARQFGGDVLILTEGGVFSLRVLLSGVDAETLPSKALTRKIEPSFLELTRGRGSQNGWDLVTLSSLGIWLVNVPWGGSDAQQVASRAANNSLCRFTGLSAACWLETGGRAFFGSARDGRVLLWGDDDVSDDGDPISWECVTAFSQFGTTGVLKRFTLVQPVLQDSVAAAVKMDMVLDWQVPTPDAVMAGPDAPPVEALPAAGVLLWGVGQWGVDRWAGTNGDVARAWRGVNGLGQVGAIRLRGVSQYTRPGWLGTGIVWQNGGPLR